MPDWASVETAPAAAKGVLQTAKSYALITPEVRSRVIKQLVTKCKDHGEWVSSQYPEGRTYKDTMKNFDVGPRLRHPTNPVVPKCLPRHRIQTTWSIHSRF